LWQTTRKDQEWQAKIKAINKSKHKQKEPMKCSRKDYKTKNLELTGTNCSRICINFFTKFEAETFMVYSQLSSDNMHKNWGLLDMYSLRNKWNKFI